MIGHVGTKVSALIDGQLPDAEAERLWDHVHACPLCRDRVEHEGWIKTRLAGLGMPSEQPAAPNYLRSVLCATTDLPTLPGGEPVAAQNRRRTLAVAVLGAGSVGAAMVGVLALAMPASAPPADRRAPATSLTGPASQTRPVTSRSQAPVGGVSSAVPSAPVARVGAAATDTTDPGWVRIKR